MSSNNNNNKKLVVLRGDVQTTVNCLFDEIVCFFFSSLFSLLRERERDVHSDVEKRAFARGESRKNRSIVNMPASANIRTQLQQANS